MNGNAGMDISWVMIVFRASKTIGGDYVKTSAPALGMVMAL